MQNRRLSPGPAGSYKRYRAAGRIRPDFDGQFQILCRVLDCITGDRGIETGRVVEQGRCLIQRRYLQILTSVRSQRLSVRIFSW